MRNQAMARKLAAREAIDVEQISEVFTDADRNDRELDGTFRLRTFIDDVDYCVRSTEQWIWSIGKRADGVVFAALDTRFYGNPRFECVWLR